AINPVPVALSHRALPPHRLMVPFVPSQGSVNCANSQVAQTGPTRVLCPEPKREIARPMAMTAPVHDLRSHSSRLALRYAAAAACARLAAACGSTVPPGSGAPGSGAPSSGTPGTSAPVTGSSRSATTAAAKISLDVSFTGSASTPAAHYTLRCDPAGGTV